MDSFAFNALTRARQLWNTGVVRDVVDALVGAGGEAGMHAACVYLHRASGYGGSTEKPLCAIPKEEVDQAFDKALALAADAPER